MPTFAAGLGMQAASQAASGLIGTGMGLLLEGHNDRRQLRQQKKAIKSHCQHTDEIKYTARKNAKTLEAILPEFLVPVLLELFQTRDPKVSYLFLRDGELIRRQQVSKAYNRTLVS